MLLIEVKGGKHDVSGYAVAALHDLPASHPSFGVCSHRTRKSGRASCSSALASGYCAAIRDGRLTPWRSASDGILQLAGLQQAAHTEEQN